MVVVCHNFFIVEILVVIVDCPMFFCLHVLYNSI